jgi:hypothetical protein
MPWSKGQSGNPGGRPKALAEVVALARAETAANVRALIRIRDAADSPPAAVVAAVGVLFDRAFGKPTQPLAGDPENPVQWVIRGPEQCASTEEWLEKYAEPALARQEQLKAIEGNAEPTAPELSALEPAERIPHAPAAAAPAPMRSAEVQQAEWLAEFTRGGRDYR